MTTGKRPDWEEFWLTLLSVGISVKAESWQHEEEVRILRQHAGQVQFSPSELVEVVFGLSTSPENKVTIRRILSGAQWAHVRFRETVRTNTLALELRDAT